MDELIQIKVDLIEFYFVNSKNVSAAIRKIHTKYGKDLPVSDITLRRYVEKFTTTASFDDKRYDQPGPSYTVTTPENLEIVEKHFQENPKDSLRRAGQKLGIPRETLRVMLRRFLKMFPYKISVGQKLTPAAMEKRTAFSSQVYQMIETSQFNHEDIIFSDEAHFHLDGYVNKQNFRFWGSERPEYFQSKSAHPIRLTAWAAITRHKIFITFFRNTVTGDSYNTLLKRSFFPWCGKNQVSTSSWFMQDGATPHRTKEVFETLHNKFGTHVIGLGYPKFCNGGMEWPPYSPDLNPCDFFLWGFLKDGVYKDSPKTITDLEKAIKNRLSEVTETMLENVYDSFARRLEACANTNGDHFEHIYA
ncbi:uncharacterized protein LOC112538930 [Tetranychus urticae]|uniref:uncharacterized protein LOC112538930 n=1 Tax=Tetranychus urticae TaxID=32264 RepID=UPI000D64AE2E|nr:uncharacterized protein LOC112538930 [Tetranychus urticae]